MSRFGLFLLSLVIPAALPSMGQQAGPRSVDALKITGGVRVDGLLNDAAWRDARTIGELVQREPKAGAAPSEPTDVRIVYDSDAMYIGVRCFDSQPGRLRSTQMRRDAALIDDDNIQILLDTFHDRRNAYYFGTNPDGVMVDGTISDNNAANLNWDGIWEVRTHIDEQGWTAEFKIPFKTVAFGKGTRQWGFNFSRRIARVREESRWTSANLDSEFTLVARAGDIDGLEGLKQGIGLDVKPYGLLGYSRDVTRAERHVGDRDAGVDVFYRLTTNLVSSTSFNTDFAETEVDTRQINLTRFPLLYPERRTFFLEDSGIFEFAAGPGTKDFTPFFSRRIGLVDGQEVPILFGQKVTGRVGRWDIGVMDVQTRDSEVAPGRNFFVGRAKANFWSQSFLGVLVTRGEPTGKTTNTQAGFDLKIATADLFGSGKNFRSLFYGSKTQTPGKSGRDTFWGGEIVYPNDLLYIWYRWRWVGENYNPALGFMRRIGVREHATGSNYRPRPKFWNMRQVSFKLYTIDYYNMRYSQTESRKFTTTPLEVEFNSGERFAYNWTPNFERLFVPFEIKKGTVIAPGDYWFQRHTYTFETAPNRPVSFKVKGENGSFYSGDSQEFSPQLLWKKDRHLTTAVELQQYWVKVKEGRFRTRLALYRLDYAFSPRLSLANFIQYDTDSRNLGLQSRLRWMVKPGNELFLVVNHAWQYTTYDRFERFEALMTNVRMKINYTFRF